MGFWIKYSEQAAADLADILRYMKDELCNPQAAQRFYQAILTRHALLRDNPCMYPLHHDDRLNAEGLRFAVMGKYLMFYTVDHDGAVVNIVRILYGMRDLPAVFTEPSPTDD